MTLSSFIEKNKTALIVATAVIAAGTGAGVYYALNNSSPAVPKPETTSSSKKKKNNRNKKKKNNHAGGDSGKAIPGGFPVKSDDNDGPSYPVIDDFKKVAPLTLEAKKELSLMFKSAGNHSFSKKDYKKGIEHYTNAIKCDDTDAIFFSNRAACYNALQDYEKVVEDTTKALELKPDYIKCFSRRAVAYEHLKKYADACLDFTSSCILSNFEDAGLNAAVDRVLKASSEALIAEKYSNMPKRLPSHSFITSFLRSFRKRTLPESITNAAPDTGNYKLKLAFDALAQETQESYEQALHLINEAVDEKAEDMALALEYRGVFRFLMDDVAKAEKDINDSLILNPTVQAYIVLSSIHIEQGNIESANLDFENALKLDPNSADVYYHRAQVAFLTADFNAAIKDYEKSLSLDEDFMYTHIQMAVTQYRMGSVTTAMDSFKKLLKKYPEASEVHNYYGEILMDQGDISGSSKEFDIAMDLEKNKKVGGISALPLINQALAKVQGMNDIAGAEALCRQAYAIDPKSDIVLGTLAQVCLQQNKVEDAYEYFSLSADLSRSESERIQALSFAGAANVQCRLIKERPALKRRLQAIASAGVRTPA